MAPVSLETRVALQRAAAVWPINAALRVLGVAATPDADEFTVFGLGGWASNDAIKAGARPIDD
jgi:hypothetical protein